jgi:hypothetical protein
MIVKIILTAPGRTTRRPQSVAPGLSDNWIVESPCHGCSGQSNLAQMVRGGAVTVDAPLVGKGANDVQPMVPGRIDHPLVPGTSVVLDFDPGVEVRADRCPDGDGAAWQARAAVHCSVGREFGGAQDHVICPRTVLEKCAQVSTDSADMLNAAWIGNTGGVLRVSWLLACACVLAAAPSTVSTDPERTLSYVDVQ